MKNVCKFLAIVIVFTSALSFFTGCSSDNTTNPNPNDTFIAKVGDALSMDFTTNLSLINLQNQVQGSKTMRTIIANMNSGGTNYVITLSVNDVGGGAGSYNIETQGLASFSVVGNSDLFFANEVRGQITLTQLDDKNWEGSFNFDAYNADKSKKIKIYNGHLNVHK